MTPREQQPADDAALAGRDRARRATVHRYGDYWGTTVTAFDIHGPHTELVGDGDVGGRGRPGRRTSPRRCDWADLADARRARTGSPSSCAPSPADRDGRPEWSRRCAPSSRDARPARGRGTWSAGTCTTHIEYLTGATGVQTNARRPGSSGKGVCQDIAHLDGRRCCARSGCRPGTSPATCTPSRRRRSAQAVTGREPRLGGVVGRRLARLRPDQRVEIGHPARRRGPRPRLRRRAAAQGHLLRPEERGVVGDGRGHPAGVAAPRCPPPSRLAGT